MHFSTDVLMAGVPVVVVSAKRALINDGGINHYLFILYSRDERDFARWLALETRASYASHSHGGAFFSMMSVGGCPMNTKQNLCSLAASDDLAGTASNEHLMVLKMCLLIALRTAEKRTATDVTSDMVANNVDISANGAHCSANAELEGPVLPHAGHVFIKFKQQPSIMRDIQRLCEININVSGLHTHDIQQSAERKIDKQITSFEGAGFTFKGFSAPTCLHSMFIVKNEQGTNLALLSQQSDPKNLLSVPWPYPSYNNSDNNHIRFHTSPAVEL